MPNQALLYLADDLLVPAQRDRRQQKDVSIVFSDPHGAKTSEPRSWFRTRHGGSDGAMIDRSLREAYVRPPIRLFFRKFTRAIQY